MAFVQQVFKQVFTSSKNMITRVCINSPHGAQWWQGTCNISERLPEIPNSDSQGTARYDTYSAVQARARKWRRAAVATVTYHQQDAPYADK
jgi:hypothetical protein